MACCRQFDFCAPGYPFAAGFFALLWYFFSAPSIVATNLFWPLSSSLTPSPPFSSFERFSFPCFSVLFPIGPKWFFCPWSFPFPVSSKASGNARPRRPWSLDFSSPHFCSATCAFRAVRLFGEVGLLEFWFGLLESDPQNTTEDSVPPLPSEIFSFLFSFYEFSLCPSRS